MGTTLRPFANGFFLLPKLSFRAQWMEGLLNSERFDDNCTPIPFPNGFDWDLGGGLSVGFDFLVWNRLYLGLAAGAGAAACFNCAPERGPTPREFRVRPQLDLSVRVGAAF